MQTKTKRIPNLKKVEGINIGEVQLPIPLEKPYRGWQIGSTENVVAAMNALKAYIDSDFTAFAALTGDSIELSFDNFQAKLSRDSAMKFFAADRPKYKDLAVRLTIMYL